MKRAKYLVCNIYDATLKIIAVAKVKANIVIPHLQLHRLAGGSATGLSATGAWVILVSLDGAAADGSSSMRLILKTSETFVRRYPAGVLLLPRRMSPMRIPPSPALLLSDGALVLANDARPRLAIGTECSAVVLGVKVRQEPSSVSLRPP